MTAGALIARSPRISRPGRASLFKGIRLSGVPWLVRETLQRRRVTILVYHDPAAATMAVHLAALRRAYNLVSLRDVVAARRAGRLDALPPKSLVVTLDDGHRGNYQLKPVLEGLGVPVTIFLCSEGGRFWFRDVAAPEAWKRLPDEERLRRLAEEERSGGERHALSAAEIEELRPLVDFQSHTASHPILPQCGSDKAAREIGGSKRDLESRYGLEVYALAYPNGDYSDRDCELARASGYEVALTVDPGFNSARTDPFRLRRIPMDDAGGPDEALVRASGVWSVVKTVIKGRPYGHMQAAADSSTGGT
jgi:peptidoglycan/xylan/chitin deacetylase (PgdA/CDA1 family)